MSEQQSSQVQNVTPTPDELLQAGLDLTYLTMLCSAAFAELAERFGRYGLPQIARELANTAKYIESCQYSAPTHHEGQLS
jgi:hypothetical protein